VVVLEELESARQRGATIYGEVIGYGMTGDANHMTAPAPGGEGSVRAMKLALADAGIAPDAIDYINAHGTSTPINDPLETTAVKTVFGEHAHKLKMSSTKSISGHLLGAAGSVEAIYSIMGMRNSMFPPTINHDEPDPACDLDYVPNKAVAGEINYALSNSLGFGGHNATLVFKKYS